MVDEEDTVTDVREHALGPLALLPRHPASGDRRRHRVGKGKDRDDDGEAETHHAPARGTRLRVDGGAALQRNQRASSRGGAESFDECPIVTTARANVAGTRVQPPGLDAKCPFGSDEVATAGKP